MATYNRSKIIQYSIKSALYQTYTNWELIVIGDNCTDDTELVVRSFDDNRIYYENLCENYGEQSFPNTYGMKLAKGEFIAFLNHDDIWLPDHLESLVKNILNKSADMTFAMIGMYGNFMEKTIIGISPSGNYEPHFNIPASSWLMKKEIPQRVGYWKSAREIIAFPSEEYIYRIWKNGFKIVASPKMTMIKPVSSAVRNSYFVHTDLNQEIYNSIVSDPRFRENFLTDVVNGSFGDFTIKVHLYKLLREFVRHFSLIISKIFKINPATIINIIAYRGGKGKAINYLRQRRGLDKLK